MKDVKKLAVALLALVAAAALGACGGGDDTTDETSGSEAVSGKFATLSGAPAAYSNLSGEATLERADGGTKVTLSLSGLEPKTAYVAHLHAGSCNEADPGGAHFQFEKGGSEEPPNEIHFEFTSDASGDATAEASGKREVPSGEAGSIVVHTADDHHAMASFDPSDAETVSTVFVHEGVDHDKEGHDDSHQDDSGGHDHAEPGQEQAPHSDKVACAQLEGGSGAGSSAGDESASGSVPTIVVRDGEPVGGIQELEFDAGEEIRFRVSSDAAEEIHVHGYDIAKDVPAGGTVEFDFPAEIEGIFEGELEGLGVQILELRVNP